MSDLLRNTHNLGESATHLSNLNMEDELLDYWKHWLCIWFDRCFDEQLKDSILYTALWATSILECELYP